jgi:hypothetical protein
MKTHLIIIAASAVCACAELHEPAADGGGNHARASLQRLRTGLSRSSEGLTLERRPDGITKVQLQGRFQNASVVGADGRATCVDSPAALDHLGGVQR